MRCVAAVIAVVVAAGIGVVFGQEAASSAAAVNARVDGLYAAIRRGDAEGAAAFYHENAVRIIGTDAVVGRANIESAMSERLRVGAVTITFMRDDTRFLTPTTAIVYGAYEVTSSTPPTTGRAMLTLVKEGADWFVAALHACSATTR